MDKKIDFKRSLKNSNLVWIVLIVLSLLIAFMVIKSSYNNPLNLPEYALKKDIVREGYEYALLHPQNLEGLPCNCGCMDPAGVSAHGGRLHSRGLLDCFMEGDPGGEFGKDWKWDSHASDCGLCIEDAILVKQKYEEGKSKEEIRQILEEKYSRQTYSNDTAYDEHQD
ncbi:hypothetical protein J4447_04880 [Candidatus Pacearchaeota archaeon]|nr:hypothetical protein [Candidatus Pacearchaeota archaeon]